MSTYGAPSVYGVALYGLSAPPSSGGVYWSLEAYLSGAWTAITEDVRIEDSVRMRRGIGGSDVRDRVASTGTMTWSLENSPACSGGVDGYYSPDNGNCRATFAIGTPVHLILADNTSFLPRIVFYGRITTIEPAPGLFDAQKVLVTARDYMDILARYKLKLLAIQTGKRSNEIINTIISAMPIAPLATSYATGLDIYPYALHTEADEKTTGLAALQKVAQSDLGYIFVRGDASGGETLVYQTRDTRAVGGVATTLSDMFTNLKVLRDVGQIYNLVRITVYPVKVDAAATTVLASAQEEFSVAAGDTLVRTYRYRDPAGAATRISGLDMVTPVANTHYKASSVAGDGGNDLNASVSVTVTFGGNSAEVSIANGAGVTAYINKLELVGKGVYLYDAVEAIAQDSPSQAAYGEGALALNLPYQSDSGIADFFANDILRRYSRPYSRISGVAFEASHDPVAASAAVWNDIGDRVKIVETLTGVDAEFFINEVELTLEQGAQLACRWTLEPAISTGDLLQEDGAKLLQEDGALIVT